MGTTVDLLSYVTDRSGTAKSGLTVELWEAGGSSASSSTSTDSNGMWSFTGQDDTKDWRIKIIDGATTLWLDGRSKMQYAELNISGDFYVQGTAYIGTLGSSLALADDVFIQFGSAASLGWETADTNANALILAMPDGDATDVPVFVLGDQSVLNVDLTWFNGITQPRIAVVDADGDSYVALGFNADDDARIILGGSGALTLPALTLAGAVAGGDQTWSNVGDMTFAAGSVLASGGTNTNTLLLKANDTTCITLTTNATDTMDLAAVNSLAAIANLDIGAYSFRAQTLIADGLTSGRVVLTTTNGELTTDSDITFSGDTLTVTKLGAFQATGSIDFNTQAMTNVDINSGSIDGVTIGAAAAPTVTDLGTVTTCNIDGGTIAGVTIDGDLTWSSAQTGVTLTSPAINGTVTTTGLTLPAFTLGGNVALNSKVFTGTATFSPDGSNARLTVEDTAITLSASAPVSNLKLGNAMDAANYTLQNVHDLYGRTDDTLAIVSPREGGSESISFWTTNVTPTYTATKRLAITGGVATAVVTWSVVTHTGIVVTDAATLEMGNAAILATGSTDGDTFLVKYKDNGVGLVNAMQVVSDADPYVGIGGASGNTFKFYYSGYLGLAHQTVIKCESTTSGHYMAFQAYDVDGTAWVEVARIQNQDDPIFCFGGNQEIQFTNSGIQYFKDDAELRFGGSAIASFRYETADANANALVLCLPEGDATDVPVLVIGDQSINNVDLGFFNGVTEPHIAIVDGDADSYVWLGFYSDDVALLTGGGSITELAIGSTVRFTNSAQVKDNVNLSFGNDSDYWMTYNTTGTCFSMWTSDGNGSGTDAEVWRIEDGQTTIDANTTWDENVFDDFDDAMMLSPYRQGVMNLSQRREDLIEMGVLKRYDDGFVGYNDQRMAALLAGGIYQTRERLDKSVDHLLSQIEGLEARIKELEDELCQKQ